MFKKKSLQDIGLQEKIGLQNIPLGGGGKPYQACGLYLTVNNNKTSYSIVIDVHI